MKKRDKKVLTNFKCDDQKVSHLFSSPALMTLTANFVINKNTTTFIDTYILIRKTSSSKPHTRLKVLISYAKTRIIG